MYFLYQHATSCFTPKLGYNEERNRKFALGCSTNLKYLHVKTQAVLAKTGFSPRQNWGSSGTRRLIL